MSRIHIHLPDPLMAKLEVQAERQGEPVGRIVAQVMRSALAGGPLQAAMRLQRTNSPSDSPPEWLPDYSRLGDWKAQIWGQLLALHERYPDELSELRDGWWRRASWIEQLSALAIWRNTIDDGGSDPREELAFHASLTDFARTIQAQPASAKQPRFEPGTPPEDWLNYE